MNKSKCLKLVFVITGMSMGGAERVMATLANFMATKGHKITILTFHKGESAYPLNESIKLVSMESGINTASGEKVSKFKVIKSAFCSFRFYLKEIDKEKPDLILSFLSKTNLMAIIGKKIKYRNIPVIVSERADPSKRQGIIQKCVEYFYKYSDIVVCQSKRVELFFKQCGAETVVIPNPINEECINKEVVYERKNKIIAAGRLDKQKNYDLLIDSFFDIHKEFNEYILEIYGEGAERYRLQEKINGLGLEKYIFLKGVRNNLMKKVSDAKLYVMSSDFEGFPNALVEAKASGIPVISTDFPTGVAKELIEDGKNGYVVPTGNRKMLSEAMKKIISDENIQNEMSNRNKELYKNLNIVNIAEKWEDLFFRTIEINSV